MASFGFLLHVTVVIRVVKRLIGRLPLGSGAELGSLSKLVTRYLLLFLHQAVVPRLAEDETEALIRLHLRQTRLA